MPVGMPTPGYPPQQTQTQGLPVQAGLPWLRGGMGAPGGAGGTPQFSTDASFRMLQNPNGPQNFGDMFSNSRPGGYVGRPWGGPPPARSGVVYNNQTGAMVPTGQAQQQFQQAQSGSMLDQMGRALVMDFGRQQSVLNENYGEQRDAYGNLADAAMGAHGLMDRYVGESRDLLRGDADRVEGIGAQGVGDAREYGERAIARQEQVLGEFDDYSALQVSQQAMAARHSIDADMKRIQGDANMTPEQKRQAMGELRNTTRQFTQSAATDLRSRFNETRAALGSKVTDTILAAGGLVGNARQNQTAAYQIGASYRQQAEQLAGAAHLAALDAQVSGLSNVAQLISANPRSVVSLFAGMAQLFQAAAAPGASRIPGVNFEGLGA